MRFALPILCILAAGLAALAARPAAFGKLALVAGMPDLAAPLLGDSHARGVALFEAGHYGEADKAFAAAGRLATYDRAMSLAGLGDYAGSVAYFDAVLFADPADADARYNRELVATKVKPVIGESNSIDGIPATAPSDGPSQSAATKRDILKQLTLAEQRGVMDPRVKRMTAATTGWLATLEDEPALYLKRRIKAEYERRQDLGLANPPEDTAW
ncbi:hypothetical protein [Aurantimonas sp. VKM B-3413]|uniref:hypothetical protein n=1 Tax=Aurantimonas sp. VKM B-3413 TaxID=2779401 RepID=UPI001E57C577|nr:hypothetical protein [Aurantimonas sp. VKM B-3413]MCB8836364.1 hypothetical protein [Aurantimonas sp. VKM B-3413]